MKNDDSQEKLPSKLNYINTHVSAIQRAFGQEGDESRDAIAKKEELRKRILNDREAFIKLYQPAAMNYARGVLLKLGEKWQVPVDVSQDVPAVWANIVVRLLEGKFTSFVHKGSEGSFRKWLTRVIANECKNHLKGEGRVLGKGGPKNATPLSDNIDPEAYDPEDQTFERTLRNKLIKKTYQSLGDDGLYGAAVLFWEKRVSEINEEKEREKFESVIADLDADEQKRKSALTQELADHLSEIGDKPITPDNAKKHLERGRDRFAEKFVVNVAKLDAMFDGKYDADRIEETLIELGFLEKQKTRNKGTGDTQFTRRLRKVLNKFRENS